MGWYGAQVILYVRFKDGDQSQTPVWENTYLIQSPDFEAALEAAAERGKLGEGGEEVSMTWGGRPAEWVFAGVRSVSEVFHQGTADVLGHGDEVLFEEFVVDGVSAVEALVRGRSVRAEFTEMCEPGSAGDAEEGPSRPRG